MGLCSGKKIVRKWEPQTLRGFLIRIAGRLLTGSRQLEFRVTENTVYKEEQMAWFAMGIAWHQALTYKIQTFSNFT